MRRSLLPLPGLLTAVVLCLLGASRGVEALEESVVVETEHYRLHYGGPRAEAEEAGRVLEAAYPHFAAHFGAEPQLPTGIDGRPRKLLVRYTRTREAWAHAIRQDGTWPPQSAGGYYWPPTRTAHLYRQPTTYFTRTLLIHEAAHQFHYLARTRNRAPAAKWYTEGVAEHLSWHRWDGTTLELGVIPGVSLKDHPAAALAEMQARDFDMKLTVGGKVEPSRAVSWALYSYLALGNDGAPVEHFVTFRRKMDRGARPAGLVARLFGGPTQLQARVIEWLQAHQSSWAQGFNEWEQIGPRAFRGHAGVVTVCHRKTPSQMMGATLQVPTRGRWRGGLLLHWTDARDYTVAMLDRWGGIQVNRRRNGRWQRLYRRYRGRDGAAGSHEFVAVREGPEVSLWIDGDEIGSWTLPRSPMGLAAENCDLTFTDVDGG